MLERRRFIITSELFGYGQETESQEERRHSRAGQTICCPTEIILTSDKPKNVVAHGPLRET
jgi:hypothetical protein